MKSIYIRTKDGALIRVNGDNILFAHPDASTDWDADDKKVATKGVTVGFADCDGRVDPHFFRTEDEAGLVTAIVDALVELGEDVMEERA